MATARRRRAISPSSLSVRRVCASRLGLGFGRVELDQDVALIHLSAVLSKDRLHLARLERLYDLRAPAGLDAAGDTASMSSLANQLHASTAANMAQISHSKVCLAGGGAFEDLERGRQKIAIRAGSRRKRGASERHHLGGRRVHATLSASLRLPPIWIRHKRP
jgi:hypothetical protein